MTAVAVWDHVPSADEILKLRLDAGWNPTPSMLKDGYEVLAMLHVLLLVNHTSLRTLPIRTLVHFAV